MLNNWTTNPRFIFFRVANGKQFTYKKKVRATGVKNFINFKVKQFFGKYLRLEFVSRVK